MKGVVLAVFDGRGVFDGLLEARSAPPVEREGVDAVQLARDVLLSEQEFRRAGEYLSGEAAAERGEQRGLSDWAKGLGWGALAVASVTPWGSLGKVARAARAGQDVFEAGRVVSGVSEAAGVGRVGEAVGDVAKADEAMLLELAGGPAGGVAEDVPDVAQIELLTNYSAPIPDVVKTIGVGGGTQEILPSSFVSRVDEVLMNPENVSDVLEDMIGVPGAPAPAIATKTNSDFWYQAVLGSNVLDESFSPFFARLISEAASLKRSKYQGVANILYRDFPGDSLPKLFTPFGHNAGKGTLYDPKAFGNRTDVIFGDEAMSGDDFVEGANAVLKNADFVTLGRQVQRVRENVTEFYTQYGEGLEGIPNKDLDLPWDGRTPRLIANSPSYGLLAPGELRSAYARLSGPADVMAGYSKAKAAEVTAYLGLPEVRAFRATYLGGNNFVPVSVVVAKIWDVIRLALEPRLGADFKHAATGVDDFIYVGDFNAEVVRAALRDAMVAADGVDLNSESIFWNLFPDISGRAIALDGPMGVSQDIRKIAASFADVNPFIGKLASSLVSLVDDTSDIVKNQQVADISHMLGFVTNVDGPITDLYNSIAPNMNNTRYSDYVYSMLGVQKGNKVPMSSYVVREKPYKWENLEIKLEDGRSLPALKGNKFHQNIDNAEQYQNQVSVSYMLREFDETISEFGSARKLSDLILNLEEPIDNIPKSVVYWHRKGNENIQALLRHGRISPSNIDEDYILEIRNKFGFEYESDVTNYLEDMSSNAVSFLDDFIRNSPDNGGIVVYRGLNRASAQSVLGKSNWDAIMLANNGSGKYINFEGSAFYKEGGFFASSLAPKSAFNFAGTHGGVVLRYEVPDNSKFGAINGHLDELDPPFRDEYELLFPRGASVVFEDMITYRDMVDADTIPAGSGDVPVWSNSWGMWGYPTPSGEIHRFLSPPIINVKLEF